MLILSNLSKFGSDFCAITTRLNSTYNAKLFVIKKAKIERVKYEKSLQIIFWCNSIRDLRILYKTLRFYV